MFITDGVYRTLRQLPSSSGHGETLLATILAMVSSIYSRRWFNRRQERFRKRFRLQMSDDGETLFDPLSNAFALLGARLNHLFQEEERQEAILPR